MGVTKAVAERFGRGGIADRMIWFNGFPFLDNKEDHSFGVSVSKAMTSVSQITVLPTFGVTLREIGHLLADSSYQGFPIVEDRATNILVGYIGRTELKYAVDRARRDTFIPPHAICVFSQSSLNTSSSPTSAVNLAPTPDTPVLTVDPVSPTRSHAGPSSHPDGSASGQSPMLDLHRFADFTPLAVHPALSLETAMEIFKKLGPRVVLVEHQGILTGLVTVKDCLKYQFKAEAETQREEDGSRLAEREEKLWSMIKSAGWWTRRKVAGWSKGRIVLGEPGDDQPADAGEDQGNGGRSDGGEVDELGRVTSRAGASLELEQRFPGGGTGSS